MQAWTSTEACQRAAGAPMLLQPGGEPRVPPPASGEDGSSPARFRVARIDLPAALLNAVHAQAAVVRRSAAPSNPGAARSSLCRSTCPASARCFMRSAGPAPSLCLRRCSWRMWTAAPRTSTFTATATARTPQRAAPLTTCRTWWGPTTGPSSLRPDCLSLARAALPSRTLQTRCTAGVPTLRGAPTASRLVLHFRARAWAFAQLEAGAAAAAACLSSAHMIPVRRLFTLRQTSCFLRTRFGLYMSFSTSSPLGFHAQYLWLPMRSHSRLAGAQRCALLPVLVLQLQ